MKLLCRLLILTIALALLFAPTPALAYPTNCVSYLRSKGYHVPQNPKKWAIYLPIKSKALPPEGKVVVIVTAESASRRFITGHVRAAINIGGKLFNFDDSVNRKRKVEIDLKKYKGYI